MNIIDKLYDSMSSLSGWVSKTARWLIIVIIAIIVFDVFMRYVLNSPTIWAWNLSYMLGACFIALGLSYTYDKDGNIRIDLIYSRLSAKKKLIIDVVFTLIIFFPLIFMLTINLFKEAWFSFVTGHVDIASIWYPKTWPFKTVVAIGFGFLSLQGIATFLKSLMTLIKTEDNTW